MTKKCEMGNVIAGFLPVLILTGVGAFLFDYLLRMNVIVPTEWNPLALISFFFLPLGMKVQFVAKLFELYEIKGVSMSEKRRLKQRIDEIFRRQVAAIVFIILGVVVLFTLTSFFDTSEITNRVVAGLFGGLVLFSVAAALSTFFNLKEIAAFRGRLSLRVEAKAVREAGLKRLA